MLKQMSIVKLWLKLFSDTKSDNISNLFRADCFHASGVEYVVIEFEFTQCVKGISLDNDKPMTVFIFPVKNGTKIQESNKCFSAVVRTKLNDKHFIYLVYEK